MRTKQRAIRSRISFTLVVALLASILVAPQTAMAASVFAGGPDQWPAFVANDHTPFAVHFTAAADGGLKPNTAYHVKIRFTLGAAPSPGTNRGYTWNPSASQWIQESDDWLSFPTVSTDASGAIGSTAGWAFAKFGDDTRSGPYYLMVSLSENGGGTDNSFIAPIVTVFDPRTSGGWVHNGSATGITAAKNARLTDEASSTIIALQKTEAQGVDDDANGADDEDYGPAGRTGDFRMGVPSATTVKVILNQAPWGPATFVTGPADTDLAIGASDVTAPSAPGAVGVENGDGTASLSWAPATDDTGVAGYHVYRWTTLPAGAKYSRVHERIATLPAGVTSYEDTTLVNGTTYYYEIRAFDAATNVGPRSGTATAIPYVGLPIASVSPTNPDGLDGWYRTAPLVTLTPIAPGRTSQYSFESEPAAWTTYTAPVAVPEGITTLRYRSVEGTAVSEVALLEFKLDTGAPSIEITAPATWREFEIPVSWNGTDTVSGVGAYTVESRVGATGDWTPWLASTDATSADFDGDANTLYYYRARTTDVAGNVGEWSETAGTLLDTPPPVTAISAPAYSTQTGTTRAFTVSWDGAAGFYDIASYAVDVKAGAGGTWTPWLVTAAGVKSSSYTSGTAGATYYFRARATDLQGNVGEWAETSGTCVPYDHTKASYTSGWYTTSSSHKYLGSAKYTTRYKSYASFTFTKGTLYLIATTGPKNGKISVYYRGVKVGTIDTYSKSTKYRQVFRLATYSAGSGSSTVKLVNQAAHNRPRIEIDGFARRW